MTDCLLVCGLEFNDVVRQQVRYCVLADAFQNLLKYLVLSCLFDPSEFSLDSKLLHYLTFSLLFVGRSYHHQGEAVYAHRLKVLLVLNLYKEAELFGKDGVGRQLGSFFCLRLQK